MDKASFSGEYSSPSPSWEIWKFWQNTHRRVQKEKKTVPDPREPDTGGSSPWCGKMEEIRIFDVAPQKPVSPVSRFTPHLRGQRAQCEARPKAVFIFSSHWSLVR
jgi:hypothetical protein